MTAENMKIEMDYFSRNFDVQHYNNAMKIWKKVGGTAPRVSSWELYDKSFSFERIRRYDYVVENMNSLEAFEDNLNTNLTNMQNVKNFIHHAKEVQTGLNYKYNSGEFTDPATIDP
jgi:hypothetical protein